MSTGNDEMEVKRIRSAEEDATEDVQPTLNQLNINDLPREVLQMILEPVVVRMCLSSEIKTAECLGDTYRRLAICRRWKDVLDDPSFHRKIRESVFKIAPSLIYFMFAKAVTFMRTSIVHTRDLVVMDFAARRIYAYYRRPYIHGNNVINVFEFRQVSKPDKQETWSYLPLPGIVVSVDNFKRIKRMQYTEFNNELVLLVETTNANELDSIYFQRQTEGEHINPIRRWYFGRSVHDIYSSPSTGKVYVLFWNANSEMISEFRYTDGLGLRLRSVPLQNIGRRLHDCHSYKFVDLNDQVNIVIHSNTRQGGVVTVPMNNFDNRHVISSRALPNISACLDSVADKHGNLFILTDEGDYYGIAFAPINQEEQVRFLIWIPKSAGIIDNSGQEGSLGFDESQGLLFLSLQTSKRILWYRVARMYKELNV